jgi:hypothetical protein
MDPDDMKKAVLNDWAEFLKAGSLKYVEKMDGWVTECMGVPEPYITGHDYGDEESRSVVYTAAEIGTMMEKTTREDRKRMLDERKARKDKAAQQEQEEFEVVCIDNSSIEQHFDQGERYMAKASNVAIGSETTINVFDIYGVWQWCDARKFKRTD